VNARRVASILRAVRVQLGLRQVDVAAAAHVSQSAVSRVERGRLGGLTFDQVQRIGDALRVSLFVDARWLDGDVDRLIDRRHAAVVEVVVAFLRRLGWEVVVEYGFNHFGERGSVDVLAWHAQTRTLLIVEVKSRLTDLQATFTSIATKLRIVPMLVRRDLEWDPIHVARLIVLPGTTANRSIVARHAATFASLFPDRMPAIRAWLRRPDRALGGVWFLSGSQDTTHKHVLRVRRRRRAAREGSKRAVSSVDPGASGPRSRSPRPDRPSHRA